MEQLCLLVLVVLSFFLEEIHLHRQVSGIFFLSPSLLFSPLLSHFPKKLFFFFEIYQILSLKIIGRRTDSAYGVLLIFGYLFFDGFTSTFQEKLFRVSSFLSFFELDFN